MKKSTKVAIAYITAVMLAKHSNEKHKSKRLQYSKRSESDRYGNLVIFFVFFSIAFLIWGVIFFNLYHSNDWEYTKGIFYLFSLLFAYVFFVLFMGAID